MRQTNKTSSRTPRVMFSFGEDYAPRRVLDAGSCPRDMASIPWPGGCWSTLLAMLPSGQEGSIFFSGWMSGWMGPLLSECRSAPNTQNIFKTSSTKHCAEVSWRRLSLRGIQGFGRWFLRGIWHPYPWTWPGGCWHFVVSHAAFRPGGFDLWSGWTGPSLSECRGAPNKTSSTKHSVILSWGRLCARGTSRVLDAGSSEGFGGGCGGSYREVFAALREKGLPLSDSRNSVVPMW